MIFSDNRYTSRIEFGTGFSGSCSSARPGRLCPPLPTDRRAPRGCGKLGRNNRDQGGYHASFAAGLLFALAATPAIAQAKEPIALRDMGSFHIGGRIIEITGQPVKEVVFTPGGVPAKVDPNGKYQVEQMYVQYFLPQNKKGKLPLLLWHGGGLSGVTYETKPDGGDGWMHYFIRKGWDTYVSDAMERGRSGWTSTFKGEAMALPFGDPWERFRMGPPGSWNDDPAKRVSYPGMQFPAEPIRSS